MFRTLNINVFDIYFKHIFIYDYDNIVAGIYIKG